MLQHIEVVSNFENSVFHDIVKHIDIWYHFLGDNIQKGAMVLEHVPKDL